MSLTSKTACLAAGPNKVRARHNTDDVFPIPGGPEYK